MTPSEKAGPHGAAESEPSSQEINTLVGLFKQGRYAEIETLAHAMTKRFPLHGFGWKAMGTVFLQQGRAAEALTHLQKAAGLSPGDAQLHNNLGNTLVELGRVPEAEASYRHALELNPGFVEAHYNLGNTLQKMGQLPEAETAYRKTLELKPDFAGAHNNLGNIFLKLGRLSEAETSCRHALKLKPDYAEAYSNLGDILNGQGRLPEAEAGYRQALALKPDLVEALNNLGVVLNKQGRFSEAEASYRRLLQFDHGSAEAHCNLGDAITNQERPNEAEASYRRALELKPDFARAHNNLGNALRDQSRLPEAIASYLRVLEIEPGLVEVRSKLVSILCVQGKFHDALEAARDTLQYIAAQDPSSAPDLGTTPITALLSYGRAGSMFFHSLFDGHPELATLPGIYFKGWFGHDVWKRFAPNPEDHKWREHLVNAILEEFQPLFDARSQKNVVGKPLGNSAWLAKYSGFMDMGTDRSQPFVVDQKAFAAEFLSLLAPLPTVGQKACFELIHRAFEIAIRRNSAAAAREGGHIFYHIHNPETLELAHFMHHYPHARLLYIVRHPVQNMESWMLSVLRSWFGGNAGEADDIASLNNDINTPLFQWNKAVGLAITMFVQIGSPFNTLAHSRGVRLEDVKRDTKRVMPQIAAWMGISDHPSLYEASFCGLQYWGPASRVTGKITGFDTKAIDQPVGRLLGSRDVTIFETLFWPFLRLYGYTGVDTDGFIRQLAEIRKWLDEPLEFENRLYAESRDHTRALKDLPPYNRLHRFLLQMWAVLDRDRTYHGMAQPLELKQ